MPHSPLNDLRASEELICRTAYVRTNIQDPVLSLTASVTFRDAPVGKGHKKGNFSIDTVSTRTAEDDYDDDTYSRQGWVAGMRELDLLGGLAGGEHIARRLYSNGNAD